MIIIQVLQQSFEASFHPKTDHGILKLFQCRTQPMSPVTIESKLFNQTDLLKAPCALNPRPT